MSDSPDADAGHLDPKQWLKLLYVPPALLVFTAILGVINAVVMVCNQGYLSHGLKYLAFQIFALLLILSFKVALRLAVPTTLLCAGYLFFFKRFDRAFKATLGVLVLWGLALGGMYVLLGQSFKDVDPLNIPEQAQKILPFDGFMGRYFIEKIQPKSLLLYPVRKPVAFWPC